MGGFVFPPASTWVFKGKFKHFHEFAGTVLMATGISQNGYQVRAVVASF